LLGPYTATLEFELALVAGQHDIGGFVQEGPHPPIAALRDAADVVDLARLMPPWNQPQIGADMARIVREVSRRTA
jgi:hypothetical protein